MAKYNLKGRIVAITGSTGGLGAAVATALVDKGAKVALFDIDQAAVEAQATSLGNAAFAHVVDVCSMDSLQLAMAAAAEHFGGIDIVLANAGITVVEPIISADPKKFERVIDINLVGVWRTFHAALPYVVKRKGHLMGVSSMAAFVHSPLQAPYTASKAGVWAMCDSIRLELQHEGVSVGSVHPTFFQTPMMDLVTGDGGLKIWGGNQSGIWKMVTLESVVEAIIDGMEKRSDMVVVPARNSLIARAPGLFRRLIERIGFKEDDIRDIVSMATRK